MIHSACCNIDPSLVIALASLVVTIATLVVTTITLFWFQNDRKHQNEKEFRNLIYENIKDLAFYILAVVKTRASKEYIDPKELGEHQESLALGLSYLRIYGKSHSLPNLVIFTEMDEEVEDSKNSFMFNFFVLNEQFLKYLDNKKGTDYNKDQKLDAFERAISRYLQLAMDYSTSVLACLKLKPNNKAYKAYHAELQSIIEYEKDNGLI